MHRKRRLASLTDRSVGKIAQACHWQALNSHPNPYPTPSPTYPKAARTNNPERVSPSRLAASSTIANTRSGSVIFTLTRLPDNFDTSASTSAHTPPVKSSFD